MKKIRFLSAFFAVLLALSLFPASILADEGDGPRLPEDPGITAKGALLLDLSADVQLYAKNAHDRLYPASLTKIMTCLLVMEAIDRGDLTMDTQVTASSIVYTIPFDSSTAGIKPGEILSVRELLYCLMVVSACEAANVLGEEVSGTLEAFISAMNKRAEELGCTDTHFINAHGLHDDGQYTSPWDVAVMTREAMKHPAFMTLCNTVSRVVPATNISPERTLFTTNRLLLKNTSQRYKNYYNGEAMGIKTGSTSQAGACLVASAKRGDRQLLSVVMGAERVTDENGVIDILSFAETNRLFRWGFDNFKWKTLMEANTEITELPVELSRTDHVLAVTKQEIAALVPNGLDGEHMDQHATYPNPTLEAPVEAGQTVGTLDLHYDIPSLGFSLDAKTELLAATDAEQSRWLTFQRDVKNTVSDIRFQIGAGAAAAAVVGLLIGGLVLRNRRSSSRYGSRRSSKGSGGYTGRKR